MGAADGERGVKELVHANIGTDVTVAEPHHSSLSCGVSHGAEDRQQLSAIFVRVFVPTVPSALAAVPADRVCFIHFFLFFPVCLCQEKIILQKPAPQRGVSR